MPRMASSGARCRRAGDSSLPCILPALWDARSRAPAARLTSLPSRQSAARCAEPTTHGEHPAARCLHTPPHSSTPPAPCIPKTSGPPHPCPGSNGHQLAAAWFGKELAARLCRRRSSWSSPAPPPQAPQRAGIQPGRRDSPAPSPASGTGMDAGRCCAPADTEAQAGLLPKTRGCQRPRAFEPFAISAGRPLVLVDDVMTPAPPWTGRPSNPSSSTARAADGGGRRPGGKGTEDGKAPSPDLPGRPGLAAHRALSPGSHHYNPIPTFPRNGPHAALESGRAGPGFAPCP